MRNNEKQNYFNLGFKVAYTETYEAIKEYEERILENIGVDAYCCFCSGVISAQESMAKNHKDEFIAQIIKQGVIKGTKSYGFDDQTISTISTDEENLDLPYSIDVHKK